MYQQAHGDNSGFAGTPAARAYGEGFGEDLKLRRIYHRARLDKDAVEILKAFPNARQRLKDNPNLKKEMENANSKTW
jgi:hypothetical protein